MSAAVAIGGTVAGATLLIIIASLCSVIWCIRQYHRKGVLHNRNSNEVYEFDSNMVNEFDSNVQITPNPSYVTKQSMDQEENQCDYIEFQDKRNSIMILNSNTSYQIAHDTTEPGCDVAIQLNSNSQSTREISEDQHCRINWCQSQNTERADYLELIGPTSTDNSRISVAIVSFDMHPNPSHA